MVLALTLITNLLLAAAALARPPSTLEERMTQRRDGLRSTLPLKVVDDGPEHAATDGSHVTYATNWAGAVHESSSNTWKSVTATFVLPKPKKPNGGSNGVTYSASAWVGIDGATCRTAILQTGVDFFVHGNTVTYRAWYEWWPANSFYFTGITFKPGDTVRITVTATTNKKGTAVVENLTRHKKVTKLLTSTHALCGKNAEWIVEDFQQGGALVPFANFGTVKFSGAKATKRSNGAKVGPAGAKIYDIKQSGKVLTHTSTTSTSVTVKHI